MNMESMAIRRTGFTSCFQGFPVIIFMLLSTQLIMSFVVMILGKVGLKPVITPPTFMSRIGLQMKNMDVWQVRVVA